MDLDERKRMILQAIIHDYIETAEPIGSRHLAKSHSLGLSSATIRNEMADLEELGYLTQPHTSAGRIPSDSGYRIYVNELMNRCRLTVHEIEFMKQMLAVKTDQLDKLVRHLSDSVAKLTNYTAIALTPEMKKSAVKKIDIVQLSNNEIIVLTVIDTGIVKNKTLRIPRPLESAELSKLVSVLNETLVGLVIEEILPSTILKIQHLLQTDMLMLNPILDCIYDMISEIDHTDIYLGGLSHMLAFNEYKDTSKSKELLNFIENKDNIASVLGGTDKDDLVTISIGRENAPEIMHDCSILISNYRIGGKAMGQIGIIGPTRMDYSKLVPFMEQVSNNLSHMLNNKPPNEEDI